MPLVEVLQELSPPSTRPLGAISSPMCLQMFTRQRLWTFSSAWPRTSFSPTLPTAIRLFCSQFLVFFQAFNDLQTCQELAGDVPLKVINDGEVTALAAVQKIHAGNVMGISMGSSEGAGALGSREFLIVFVFGKTISSQKG